MLRNFRRTSSTNHLAGRPEQLDLKNPVADEICCYASLSIAIERGRLAMLACSRCRSRDSLR